MMDFLSWLKETVLTEANTIMKSSYMLKLLPTIERIQSYIFIYNSNTVSQMDFPEWHTNCFGYYCRFKTSSAHWNYSRLTLGCARSLHLVSFSRKSPVKGNSRKFSNSFRELRHEYCSIYVFLIADCESLCRNGGASKHRRIHPPIEIVAFESFFLPHEI